METTNQQLLRRRGLVEKLDARFRARAITVGYERLGVTWYMGSGILVSNPPAMRVILSRSELSLLVCSKMRSTDHLVVVDGIPHALYHSTEVLTHVSHSISRSA